VKVLVCGSRAWLDSGAIRARLAELPRGTTIIHGGARGADRLAETIAHSLGFDTQAFNADWHGRGYYDPAAGKKRNLRMLDQQPDLVIAFHKDGSTGTAHTIENAHARGIPVEVIGP